ncbi:MAG: hypothetical protein IPH35_02310 [Rhodoferax sp.]|nr:hypothetical protein [Rhodoferax sp.]
MHEALALMLAWIAGGVIGAFFFGGLWWTVRKSFASTKPDSSKLTLSFSPTFGPL